MFFDKFIRDDKFGKEDETKQIGGPQIGGPQIGGRTDVTD